MAGSSSINALLAEQMRLGEEIQSLIRNYKKDSAQRKSKLGYFEGRLCKLQLLWNAFNDGEKTIKTRNEKTQMEHTYFKSNFFEKIMTLIVSYIGEFIQKLPTIEDDTENVHPLEKDTKHVATSPQNSDAEFDSKLKEQRKSMGRIEEIIKNLERVTRNGINPIILPYLTLMKKMHAEMNQTDM
ncbi:uncharacterized protein LOC27206713 [Drosophila simulans]|uniref:uncharacterized protein LOC27206713 n=1 Tax=Drosophila simulans TaxID=7240 RepID=UPI00078AE70F|nr:uncharacterized protein LOC27206713 [Drosophila simulans]KMZ08920.1 uncharacterized protein Dsimw501_GD26861 [Drosophila simulans]